MHYYKFNIGDYCSHTQHLEPLEDVAYRRMLDWYYLHESPLPNSIEMIARLIRMRTHSDCIANVLNEFFTLTEYGYKQTKADKEIEAYRAKSQKAKESAMARWGNSGETPETPEQAETPIDAYANAMQPQSERNANHKPLTTNHKPLNKETKDLKDLPAKAVNFSVLEMSDFQITEVKRIRRLNKGGPLSQRSVNGLAKEFKAAREMGYATDELLTEWEVRGWKAFKAIWIEPKPNQPKAENTKSAFDKSFDDYEQSQLEH